MAEVVERNLFTVGVFKDPASADAGVAALAAQGFAPAAMSYMAKDGADAAALIERLLGRAPDKVELSGVGPAVAAGELLTALQGHGKDLARTRLSAAMRRAGFQPHDGLIYETLIGRGGVLVAVHGAPRVADALAVMLSYGGGNAAIGAWGGRV
jgi:hypothetical protein